MTRTHTKTSTSQVLCQNKRSEACTQDWKPKQGLVAGCSAREYSPLVRGARAPTSFLGQRSVMESRAPTEVETWDAKDLHRKQKTKKSKTLDTEPLNLWSPTWDNSRFKGSAVKLVTYDMVKTQDAMWPGKRSFDLTRRDFEEIVGGDPDRSV